jgi:alkylation response protein AidB-like acyl-CoA dehydrogenase
MDDREKELVAAVRELARGPFAERAARYDRDGAFPHENVADLKQLGLAGMSLAADIGGLGLSAEAQMRVIEQIAYGDGSTAVALNMHRIGVDLVNTLPPFPLRNSVLEEVAKQGTMLCAPGSIPTGELDNRGTGFRAVESGPSLIVNGRAGFASMSEGASYVFLVAAIEREGGEPDFMFTLPRTDAPGLKLLYNWDAMGLRGTASHDIVCEGLEVDRADALVLPTAMLRAVFQVLQTQTGPAVQMRSLGTLGILAIWLGLARAAFDFTVDYVAKRHGYLAGTSSAIFATPGFRSEQPWAQTAIGNMEHWLETGNVVFYDTVARLNITFDSQQEFTRHLVRTVYHLRRMTEEVAMGAMKVCGAHAYVRTRPLERIVRDMLGGVVMAWKTDELVQMLGKSALGMPITIVGPAGS